MHGFWLLLASSTTSLAISTLCSICLPCIKADCLSSIMDGSTFFNLLASNLATILYIHPISEIGQNSLRFCGSATFGIKAIKDALQPLGKIPLMENSSKNRIISGLMTCRNSLINLKFNPSGPGHLSFPQSPTAFCISSSLKYQAEPMSVILLVCESQSLGSTFVLSCWCFSPPPSRTRLELLHTVVVVAHLHHCHVLHWTPLLYLQLHVLCFSLILSHISNVDIQFQATNNNIIQLPF